jgi:phosphocarrier protein
MRGLCPNGRAQVHRLRVNRHAKLPQERQLRVTEMDGAAPGPSATMLSRTVTVVNMRGLHARAAAKFVTLAERYGASVEVLRDGQSVSARSIMGLMMLGAGQGSQLELQADGWDAKEALDALASLVEAGFNERD